MIGVLERLQGVGVFVEAYQAQKQILREFHRRSSDVLVGECRLEDYTPADFSIQRNVFSTLFLAAEICAGLPKERLPFYGLVNQCMRAWVTGCDNILDDEYKTVLPFALPEGGHRARSVLTIMTADRVFTDLLCEEMAQGRLTAAQCAELSHDTLRALIPSALQEDTEEMGARTILSPDDILTEVHVPKTGLLFEAPLVPPEKMGEIPIERSHVARSGLRAFGLACQILDDLVDLEDDLRSSRHNLVLSIAAHGAVTGHKSALPRGEIDLTLLPVEESRKEACRWSAHRFTESRNLLATIGLQAGDEEWKILVLTIAGLLRVPPDCQATFEEAL